MELWAQLFSDSVGILSAFVIGFTLLMAVWFAWYFITHMMSDSKAQNPGSPVDDIDKHHQ